MKHACVREVAECLRLRPEGVIYKRVIGAQNATSLLTRLPNFLGHLATIMNLTPFGAKMSFIIFFCPKILSKKSSRKHQTPFKNLHVETFLLLDEINLEFILFRIF